MKLFNGGQEEADTMMKHEVLCIARNDEIPIYVGKGDYSRVQLLVDYRVRFSYEGLTLKEYKERMTP